MPISYLLDTNVLSETRKRRADEKVISFLAATAARELFISVLSLGELRKGVSAKRLQDPDAAEVLARWVDGVEVTFGDRVLQISAAVARIWGELSAGRTLPVIDTLIAATALTHDLTLVTCNVRGVAATGVHISNPWQAT